MTDEILYPVGSTVNYLRAGASQTETATVTERFDNGGTAMATLNFNDGTVLQVTVDEIQG